MKITGSIEINKPIELVTKLFADPTNLKEYQDGFLKKEIIKGIEGQKGTQAKMYYQQGKNSMILTETILDNQLPQSFEALYHHEHMDNTMKSTFSELGPNKTRYDYEIEYTRINWVMPRLMSILFPNLYQKPVKKWMTQFKAFVEKQ